MLTRAIMDHVPPILECEKFYEVANNYGIKNSTNENRSFKKAMKYLEDFYRNIADGFLHQRIRNSESLPNVTQVRDSSSAIDRLLEEIVRILKKSES